VIVLSVVGLVGGGWICKSGLTNCFGRIAFAVRLLSQFLHIPQDECKKDIAESLPADRKDCPNKYCCFF